MRGVVPGDFFSCNKMLPGFVLLTSAGPYLNFRLIVLKANGVKRTLIVFCAVVVTVVVVVILFHFTLVLWLRSSQSLGACLHCEEGVHSIWEQQWGKIPTKSCICIHIFLKKKSGQITCTMCMDLTADKKSPSRHRSQFCCSEGHGCHLHGDFTMI